MKKAFKFLLAAACFCLAQTAFSQTLAATTAVAKPAIMDKDFAVVFSERPRQGQSYLVDFSQVAIKEEKLMADILAKGDSRLSGFSGMDFQKKTVNILLKEEIPLPEKFGLESWNQYFSQMARVMQTALPKTAE